ncbi:MAG: hypothetical protein ACLUKN_12615 [Bacilli bacterium]
MDNFVKIVEWGTISEIADSDYHANKYGDLNAVFDSHDDGLYVMYSRPRTQHLPLFWNNCIGDCRHKEKKLIFLFAAQHKNEKPSAL